MPFPFNPMPNPVLAAASLQTPQQLKPINPAGGPVDLGDVQGDILVGLQKNAQRLVFFRIGDIALFKQALRGVILPKITSCADAHERENRLRDNKIAGAKACDEDQWESVIEMCGTNIAFTPHGLQKLIPGLNTGALPPAFLRSSVDMARTCGDRLDTAGATILDWDPAFPRDDIDGVLNLAGSSPEAVDKARHALLAEVEHSISEVWEDGAVGRVRPGRLRGHEHFGWKDGISQPAIEGLADPLPGQTVVPAGNFVLGVPGRAPLQPGNDWMANGSYMVFRKLEQDVAAFRTFVKDQAVLLGMDPPLLAARMMGRWPSGAPLAKAPLADDPTLGADALRNDDFDYSDDPHQRRCPYGAHVRKTNPRSDPDQTDANLRIMRQGIPYGTEFENEAAGQRGLPFVCYQADIAAQFEKQQHDWANVSDFPPNKHRPTSAVFTQRQGQAVRSGLDPIIGQPGQSGIFNPSPYGIPGAPPQAPSGMDEPLPNYPSGAIASTLPESAAQTYVRPKATLYLFVPSKSAIAMRLSAA